MGVADITPDQPLPLAGIGGGARLGHVTLDPLNVRALHVAHDGQQLVLVAVDTLYVSRDFCSGLEQWLEREHDIPGKNLFVTATHTHCAPLVDNEYRGGVPLDDTYVELVVEKTRLAITAAIESSCLATMAFGAGTAPVSINRRLKRVDRDSLRRLRPARTMINRPNPRGPVDNVVRCIRFGDSSSNSTDIWLLSVGCHPSILRSEVYSADFPGLIEKHLKEFTGRAAHAVFVQGFSGDTRARLLERAPFMAWPPSGAFEWLFDRQRFRKNSLGDDAEWVAREIARTAAATAMTEITAPRLSAATSEVLLSLSRRKSEDEADTHIHVPESRYGRDNDDLEDDGIKVGFRMRRWSLSENVRLVGLEGEIFSEYALWMKTALQDKGHLTVPVSCVGGMVGYIPTAEALSEGGYEIDRSRPPFGLPARFAPSVEQTVKHGLRTLVGV